MQDNANHTYFPLPPLTTEDTQRLLDAILRHVDNVPSDLRALISERAEGNPLFVEEFLRMLFDNGVLERAPDDGRWTVNSFRYRTMESELPNGLLGVFQARLDDLPGPVRRVVQIAAVVGQTFWDGAVSALAAEDPTDKIKELVIRGIVVELPRSVFDQNREYTFRNTLYHEVAYSMLPRTHRTTYHRQAAAWMANQPEIKPEVLGLLAGHYMNAEQPLDALRTYTEAAEHQLARGQLTETIAMVESGLAAVREINVREDALPYVSRLWLVQARAAHSRRNYSEATAASTTALMLLDELPNETMCGERVLASVTLGNAHTSLGNYYQAQEALTQAEAYLTDDPTQQGWVQRAFGLLFWSRGNLTKAEASAQQALVAAEVNGETREVAAALSMLGRVALDRGDFSSALDYMEQVLAMNRETGNILYQVVDMHLIAAAHRLLFAYDRAMAILGEAQQLADRINYDTALLRANQGLTLIGQGAREAGLSLLRAADTDNHLNTHDHYEVKLALLRGLAQCGHNEACLTLGQTFIDQKLQSYSRVLYGRGLLWYGVAQRNLGVRSAAETLRAALENEIRYGGRDVWLCYYALSLALPAAAAEHHRARAHETLNAIAASLYRRPELAAVTADPGHIARVFGGSPAPS
jgi:predicted ATPase